MVPFLSPDKEPSVDTEYMREQRQFRARVRTEKRNRRKAWLPKWFYRFGKKPTKS